MTAAVVSVGSLNLDRTLEVEHLPAPGETLIAHGSSTSCGGKGANQAAAAAAAGAAVAMVGAVGDDQAGQVMVADLAARGIDVAAVRTVAGVRSGGAVIVVDAERGENSIVVDPGANHGLRPEDVRIAVVADAAVLVAQLEVPLEAVQAAVEHCAGVVVLNAAPARPLDAELLGAIDLLVVNQSELAALAQTDVPSGLDQIRACVDRLDVPCSVIVTAGAAGAFVRARARLVGTAGVDTHWRGDLEIPAPRLTPLDTTGAGDCFCGVLAARLATGLALDQAAAEAVIAASRSTLTTGARVNQELISTPEVPDGENQP